MAVARVNTYRPFNSSSFFDTMKFMWGLEQTAKFREAGENLFIFQMFRGLEIGGARRTMAVPWGWCDN